MDLFGFIQSMTATPGLSGSEMPVARAIAEAFAPYVDEYTIDNMQNVVARAGGDGPRVMLCAHQDEIGLIVRAIEKDGAIRFAQIGGVDPRILPALEVDVLAKDGALFGVVGSKPPHVQTAADRGKSPKHEDLYIDIGFSADEVAKRVRAGDRIMLRGPARTLDGDIVSSKTLDDRACVAAMLEAARRLARMKTPARTFFVASAQEEIGGYGAHTSSYAIDPDIAIALDVTHAETPGLDKLGTYPMDKVVLTTGPVVHPMLLERIKKIADEHRVAYAIEASGSLTWTDADDIQTVRMGIPTLLVSVPVRYMHTTVETVDLGTIREAGRLVAHFIDDLVRDWEGLKWY